MIARIRLDVRDLKYTIKKGGGKKKNVKKKFSVTKFFKKIPEFTSGTP